MFQNNVFKVSVNTKQWAKAAGIRAIKTMAQTAVAVIGTGAVISAVAGCDGGCQLSASSYKVFCDYLGPILIIQDNALSHYL